MKEWQKSVSTQAILVHAWDQSCHEICLCELSSPNTKLNNGIDNGDAGDTADNDTCVRYCR